MTEVISQDIPEEEESRVSHRSSPGSVTIALIAQLSLPELYGVLSACQCSAVGRNSGGCLDAAQRGWIGLQSTRAPNVSI